MKTCTRCKKTRLLTEFHKDRCTVSGFRPWCKICAVADTLRYQQIGIDAINKYKAQPCMDCGVEYPPEVMDLDHVRGIK